MVKCERDDKTFENISLSSQISHCKIYRHCRKFDTVPCKFIASCTLNKQRVKQMKKFTRLGKSNFVLEFSFATSGLILSCIHSVMVFKQTSQVFSSWSLFTICFLLHPFCRIFVTLSQHHEVFNLLNCLILP